MSDLESSVERLKFSIAPRDRELVEAKAAEESVGRMRVETMACDAEVTRFYKREREMQNQMQIERDRAADLLQHTVASILKFMMSLLSRLCSVSPPYRGRS